MKKILRISNSLYRKVEKYEPKRRKGVKYLTIEGILYSKLPAKKK